MFAVNEGYADIVQELVSAGADVHIKDKVCGVLDYDKYCMENHVHSMLAINRHKKESRHGELTLIHVVREWDKGFMYITEKSKWRT